MKVFRQFKIGMGKGKMADVLYAVIMCSAKITSTFGIGIYQYSRLQNCYNTVDIMIEIDESKISKFESLASLRLEEPQQAQVNALSATSPEPGGDKNDVQ